MTRILVVDDEKDLVFLIQKFFEAEISQGVFDFYFAHNGQEALDMIHQSDPFQVMITDIGMPKLDGIGLLQAICKHNTCPKTIVISAYDDFRYVRQAMNHGAFDFMAKPLDFKELAKVLKKCVATQAICA